MDKIMTDVWSLTTGLFDSPNYHAVKAKLWIITRILFTWLIYGTERTEHMLDQIDDALFMLTKKQEKLNNSK